MNTCNQTQDFNWFKFHKNRYTAALCIRIEDLTEKTERGIKTIAHDNVFGNKIEKNTRLFR